MIKSNVINFGCRLNIFESQFIQENLDKHNIENTLIFNTCAVTKEAERQAKQAIRKARKTNPNARIIVTGCAAQIKPDLFSNMEEVNVVLGNEEKLSEETFVKLSQNNLNERVLVNDIMSIKETSAHLVNNFDGKSRAFIQIQNGCNHRCTFCTIPFGRGNSRSVKITEIINQINILTDKGFKEIVLTGVDITDYGKDLPGSPTLGQVIKRILKFCPSLNRLRLSSIDVAEIDQDLLELIYHEPRFMPHLHISLQSGDNLILKRMKRRHNREQVIEFCRKVREIRPDISFGADLITGFPTETEIHFSNTIDLVKKAEIAFLHIFPYSPREGTPASRMPQVDQATRKKRASELKIIGEEVLHSFQEKFIGKDLNVLLENNGKARAENFLLVNVDSENYHVGDIAKVKINRIENNQLYGYIV